MSDETDPPESAALPAQDDLSAPADPARAEGEASAFSAPFVPGQRWRNYQIGDRIETTAGWSYDAVDINLLENIVVHVTSINEQTEMRAQAWRELKSLNMPGLLAGDETFDEGEYRYEISHQSPKATLREWAAARKASLDDVQSLVQQLSDVIIAMHDRGVVHLNLQPDTIFILSENEGLKVGIGGVEHATVYNQPGLIPVPVDPMYAPPEAAGLAKHSPGAALRAWDWWSLGRIIQELVLGRHVLSIVTNRDVSKPTPELRSRAEVMLLERDPRAPRAGAVELMPPMSQRLTDLLRGLLTSSRGGRWGTDEVLRWLKQQPVKDRYQLGRNEELFAWKDRVFTMEEAAEYFTREENWADGLTNLFDTEDAMTLVSFVGERPEYRPLRERIEELHKFTRIPNWSDLPEEVRRNAVTAAAWLLIGGEGMRLVLYGQPVDAACIKSLFARGNIADGVPMVKAITTLPFIQMIEQADPTAARLLSTLATAMAGETTLKAIKEGWLNLTNPADYARVLLLAMEPERKLLELRKVLQTRFACSREPHIQQLFSLEKLRHAELVLLASTAAQPERFAYVTHDEWTRERHEALKQRAERLARALFWLRLGQVLRAGYPIYGAWPVVLGIWISVGVAAGWPAGAGKLPGWILGLVTGAAALRFASGLGLSLLISRKAPGVAPWQFLTKIDRCTHEAIAALGTEAIAPRSAAVRDELAAISTEVAGLVLNPLPPPLPKAGRVLPAWAGALAGWSLAVLVLVTSYWKPTASSSTQTVDPKAAAAEAIEKALKAGAGEVQRTAEDDFYDNPTKPRARWNVARPAEAPAVPLAKVKPASPDDVAMALIEGQRLLLPYQQSTVDSLIAVPVEGKSGSGLMLYDGRNRRVIERQVLLPAALPAEQSWIEVDKIKVFYAGPPPPPPAPPPKPEVDPQKPVDTSDLSEREVRRGAYQDSSPIAEQKATNAQPLSDALDTMSP
jgi:hypothetical protein